MKSTTHLVLNLQLPNIAVVAYAVQGDALTRTITAQLVDGSEAWTPPAGALAAIRYLKPDGTGGFYDTDEDGSPAVTVDGSTAQLRIARQALTVAGDVIMQLQFYTAAGERLSTFNWRMVVQPLTLTDTALISSDYYNVLTEQIAGALQAAADAQTSADAAAQSAEDAAQSAEDAADVLDAAVLYTAQTKTDPEKAQARANIGAVAATDYEGSKPLTPASAFSIPASGSSVSYNMAGITSDHRLVSWGFSASAENAPTAALTWTTYNGWFTIANNGGAMNETMRPVFLVPKSVAITAR